MVVMGYLAFLASVKSVYLHGMEELVGWRGLPALVVLLAVPWAAFRLRRRPFWRNLAFFGAALVGGTVLGAAGGAIGTDHASGPWAGGLMGGAAGTLLGTGVVAMRAWRRPTRGAVAALAAFLILGTAACRPDPDPPPREARVDPIPDSSRVESVVFFLGDPGMARMDSYPILPRLRRDVEAWSARMGEDGAVRVLVLGDVLYPDGMSAPDGGTRTSDSLRVVSQIGTVAGPRAEAVGTRALFLPGNHDWGQELDEDGEVRLRRLADFLDAWSGPGAGRVTLHPRAGTGGPDVVDVGDHVRLVLLDTAWWLLGREPGETRPVMEGVRRALETAGDRTVVVAAHHPLETGGPHGMGVDLGSLLGLRTLLKKAGILLQDLDSRPYSSLRGGLLDVFEEVGRPDLFVGGHEHSLQVFEGGMSGAERAMVVGSASKLTGVTEAPGMLFGRSEPGYGKLLALDDGSVHLVLEAAPSGFLSCGDGDGPGCMEEGVAAYRTVWSETVDAEEAGPDPLPGRDAPSPGAAGEADRR